MIALTKDSLILIVSERNFSFLNLLDQSLYSEFHNCAKELFVFYVYCLLIFFQGQLSEIDLS